MQALIKVHCSFCAEACLTLTNCSVCRNVNYCSVWCKVADATLHAQVCLPPDQSNSSFRLSMLLHCTKLPLDICKLICSNFILPPHLAKISEGEVRWDPDSYSLPFEDCPEGRILQLSYTKGKGKVRGILQISLRPPLEKGDANFLFSGRPTHSWTWQWPIPGIPLTEAFLPNFHDDKVWIMKGMEKEQVLCDIFFKSQRLWLRFYFNGNVQPASALYGCREVKGICRLDDSQFLTFGGGMFVVRQLGTDALSFRTVHSWRDELAALQDASVALQAEELKFRKAKETQTCWRVFALWNAELFWFDLEKKANKIWKQTHLARLEVNIQTLSGSHLCFGSIFSGVWLDRENGQPAKHISFSVHCTKSWEETAFIACCVDINSFQKTEIVVPGSIPGHVLGHTASWIAAKVLIVTLDEMQKVHFLIPK